MKKLALTSILLLVLTVISFSTKVKVVAAAALPTPTPVPCPYGSLQMALKVNIDGEWKEWRNPLTINQWQTDQVEVAAFADCGDPDFKHCSIADDRRVKLYLDSSPIGGNPAEIGGQIHDYNPHDVSAQGRGICDGLGSNTARIKIVYCPYKEIFINSNRGRPCDRYNPNCNITDPWLTDITINKKDVKQGRVLSGTYYNNGGASAWAQLSNLEFFLEKPNKVGLPNETLNFRNAQDPSSPYRYKIPPSWYTPGFYLNRPGTFTLTATGTNGGASCGDYPPEASGHINVLNCSYDSTVGGFQEVATPPKAWSDNLYLPFAGSTVKSGGFHDLALSSIDPGTTDIKIYTPANQVILKILGPNGFDQRADQGAPFTYTGVGDYTLYVSTPDLDTPDPEDIEDGPGCFAQASLHIGANPPNLACVEKGQKISCCPFNFSAESLWSGLVDVLGRIVGSIGENNLVPFKIGVAMDKIEFTADRIAHSNYLFGTVKEETTASSPQGGIAPATTTKTFEPGSLFFLSPPGTLKSLANLNTEDTGSDTTNIAKREERISWDVSLDSSSTPLKKGDIESIEPVAFSGEQLQKYLTRLPSPAPSVTPRPGGCTVVTACVGKTLDPDQLYHKDTCKIPREDPGYPDDLRCCGTDDPVGNCSWPERGWCTTCPEPPNQRCGAFLNVFYLKGSQICP